MRLIKIAVALDGNQICTHFGRCPQFLFITIENHQIVQKEIVENPGHYVGSVPKFLKDNEITYLICGNIGIQAKNFLRFYNVTPILGIAGNVNETVQKFLSNSLIMRESSCIPGSGKDYGIPRIDEDDS